jgi:RHS repeat-associated protein
LPVHDTQNIVAALVAAASTGNVANYLAAVYSADGTVSYAYDSTGQLIGATYSGEGLPDESYAWDANGNPTGAGCIVGLDNLLLSDGTYRYLYDAEGNRTVRFIDVNEDGLLGSGDTDITQYAWDARNRLVEVRDYADYSALSDNLPTQVVDYLYDVENRWIGKNIDSDGDGTVDHQTRFVYDGNQIVLQFDKAGTGAVTGADLSHRYLWQPDVVDQIMADEQLTGGEGLGTGGGFGYDLTAPGNVIWPLADQLGTVRDLAVYDAQTGITSIANHRVYGSFGSLKSQTNAAVDCLFGFTGKPVDNSTGLRSHWHRWTNPEIADWMSKDPTGFMAGDANTSRYCANRPTILVDPTGLTIIAPAGVDITKYLEGLGFQITRKLHDPLGFRVNDYPLKKGYSVWNGLLINDNFLKLAERGEWSSIEQEIIAGMLQSGRKFMFSGTSAEALAKLKENVGVRLSIIGLSNPGNQKIAFGVGADEKNNTEFWTSDWHVKTGHTAAEAILDAVQGHPNLYATGCTNAAALDVLGGILLWHQSHDTPEQYAAFLTWFNQQLGDSPLSRAVYTKVVVHTDTGVPWHNWIPGDWGWIMNVRVYYDKMDSSGGLGGKNIIYVGAGKFYGGYRSSRGTYGNNLWSLDDALLDVASWHHQDQNLSELRCDPIKRSGSPPTRSEPPRRGHGGLRHVRDYPAIW